MKLKTITVCMMLIMLVSGASQAAPHLTIAEPNFDFGIVPQRSKISHVFWLKNDGTDTLRITKIVPG